VGALRVNRDELIAHIAGLMRREGVYVLRFSPAAFWNVQQPMARGCGLPQEAGIRPSGAVGRAVTTPTLRELKARSTRLSAPHAAEL